MLSHVIRSASSEQIRTSRFQSHCMGKVTKILAGLAALCVIGGIIVALYFTLSKRTTGTVTTTAAPFIAPTTVAPIVAPSSVNTSATVSSTVPPGTASALVASAATMPATMAPTSAPTAAPTMAPTPAPTSAAPTLVPTLPPTSAATVVPSRILSFPLTTYVYEGLDCPGNDMTSFSLSAPPYTTWQAALTAFPSAQALVTVRTGNTALCYVKSQIGATVSNSATAITTFAPLPGVQATRMFLAAASSSFVQTVPVTQSQPVLALTSVTVPPAPTLSNQPLKWAGPSGTYDKYLDCAGGACNQPANRVEIWQGSGTQGQLWTWKNGGLYSGGQVLATLGNGTTNGTSVISTTDSGSGGQGGQQWVWQRAPDGNGWQLLNPMSGRCLDIAGGTDANGTIAQLWDCPTSSSHWMPVAPGQ